MKTAHTVIVALCFFLSGFSALVYQAAWASYLGLVFGTSQLAVATVLSAYMFGLATGAYLASRFVHRVERPVLIYGILEGLIAVSAMLVPLLITLFQALYVSLFGGQAAPVSGEGMGQPLYFLLATFVMLFVPTTAMGATLPLLARYLVASRESIGAGVGLLYGINTAGAVVGVLCSGFLLLPRLGLSVTVLIAVATNVAIFLLVLWRAREFRVAGEAGGRDVAAPTFTVVYLLALATGVLSFTLEVFWTRLLSHILGGTSYAFAIMLASFLSGIAAGGYAGGRVAVERDRAMRYFAAAHGAVLLTTGITYLLICAWEPDPGAAISARAVIAFLALFPSTFFIGATFPLAVRAVAETVDTAASCTGRVYAWNTLGAIGGAVLAGFVLLPGLGFAGTMRFVLLGVATIAAVSLLVGRAWAPRYALAAATILGILLLAPMPRPASVLTAHVRSAEPVEEIFYAVGRSSTVLLHRENGFFKLASNGLSESAIGSRGMPPFQLSQKWLSALPALARPDARDMLIVGLGGGIALQGVPPYLESVDTVELEPRVLDANLAVRSERTLDPLADPRVNVVLNDARNALLLTDKRYDVIVSQPSHPWTGGASHLYTKEFLALSKSRMNASGVFLQWINSQFIDEALLRVMAATLHSQFEYVELYQPERQVLMFLASDKPLDIWDGAQHARQVIAAYPEHFRLLGMRTMEDVLAMLTFDSAAVRQLASGARANSDDENLLAYRSRPRSDGLTAEGLLDAFPELDPLANSASAVHRRSDTLSFAYIAERLLQGNFIKRVHRFARAIEDPVTRQVVDALGLEYTGDEAGARQLLRAALARRSTDREAALALLRLHLGDFASRNLTPDIAQLANQLRGPSRAALEGWVFGAAGNFERLMSLDERLALIDPRSQLYPVSVKLRVDWRLWKAIEGRDAAIAAEAMDLLDALLPSYWNADLYLLRAAVAAAAGRPFAMVESYAAALSQLRNEERLAPVEHRRAIEERRRAVRHRFENDVADIRDPALRRRIEEIRLASSADQAHA